MHVVHITRGVGIGWYTKEVIKKEGFNKQQQQEWQKRIADKEAAYKEIYDRLASTCQHTRTGIRRGQSEGAAARSEHPQETMKFTWQWRITSSTVA
jgi:hypothetical protein